MAQMSTSALLGTAFAVFSVRIYSKSKRLLDFKGKAEKLLSFFLCMLIFRPVLLVFLIGACQVRANDHRLVTG
jgi:hypothetical protein